MAQGPLSLDPIGFDPTKGPHDHRRTIGTCRCGRPLQGPKPARQPCQIVGHAPSNKRASQPQAEVVKPKFGSRTEHNRRTARQPIGKQGEVRDVDEPDQATANCSVAGDLEAELAMALPAKSTGPALALPHPHRLADLRQDRCRDCGTRCGTIGRADRHLDRVDLSYVAGKVTDDRARQRRDTRRARDDDQALLHRTLIRRASRNWPKAPRTPASALLSVRRESACPVHRRPGRMAAIVRHCRTRGDDGRSRGQSYRPPSPSRSKCPLPGQRRTGGRTGWHDECRSHNSRRAQARRNGRRARYGHSRPHGRTAGRYARPIGEPPFRGRAHRARRGQLAGSSSPIRRVWACQTVRRWLRCGRHDAATGQQPAPQARNRQSRCRALPRPFTSRKKAYDN